MWGLDAYHDSPGGVPPHVGNPYVTRIGKDLSGPDAAVQQATVNLFADMGVQPGSLASHLVAAVPPAPGCTPPKSEILSITIEDGSMEVQGVAQAHAMVAGVEISVDGKRWHPAHISTDGETPAEVAWRYRVIWQGADH